MEKREPLFTDEHFSEVIKSFTRKINETTKGLSEHPEEYKNISFVYYCFYMYHCDLITAKYSAGYPVEELKRDAVQAIHWLVTNMEHPEHDIFYLDELQDYLQLLQSLSFGFLFQLDKSILKKVLDLFEADNPEVGDALVDKLATFLKAGSSLGGKLQHPKAYQALYDAINATKDEQPKLMQKFLKGWYKSMRKCGWHDVHLSVGKDRFPGYWCWEAAMVTVLYGIDDTSYRDMPFYPKDLVDYAKQQNP